MLEEKLDELVSAVDNLGDQQLHFDEQTDIVFDWIGTSLHRIAEALEKIEAKMK